MPARKVIYDNDGDQPVALERYAVVANELVRNNPERFSFAPKVKPAKADKAVEFEALKKAELLDLARVHNVDVTEDNNKSEIIDKLRAANVTL